MDYNTNRWNGSLDGSEINTQKLLEYKVNDQGIENELSMPDASAEQAKEDDNETE